MPVIFNKPKDKNQLSGAPQLGGSQGGASFQASAPQQATSSGRFTNIQNYLSANKGAGQNLASNIGGQIQGKSQEVKQGLGQAQGQFAQKAEEGRLDKSKVLPEAQNIIKGAGENMMESDVDRFKRISSGAYKGPQNLANASQLAAQGREVESLGKNLGTSSGRTAVLGQFYGGQGYTAGQKKLDDLLISSNAPTLQRARGSSAGIERAVNRGDAAAQALGQYYGQEASEVGQEVGKNLQTATKTDQDALREKFQKTRDEAQAFNEELRQTEEQLANAQLQKDAIQRLSLDRLLGVDSIYNTNLKDYAKTNITDLPETEAEVASRQEAGRINALMKLGSRDNVFDLDKVNTFKKSEQSFDIDKLLSDIEQRKGQYAGESRAANYLNQLADVSRARWEAGNAGGSYHDVMTSGGATDPGRMQIFRQRADEAAGRVAQAEQNAADALKWGQSGGYNIGNENELRQLQAEAAARAAALQAGRKFSVID